MALLEGQQVASLVVGLALDPTAVEDSDPLEGERSEGSLVPHAASSTALLECLRPEGARDGLAHPLDEGLAQEGRAGLAPMGPGLVATSFSDRRDAGVLL